MYIVTADGEDTTGHDTLPPRMKEVMVRSEVAASGKAEHAAGSGVIVTAAGHDWFCPDKYDVMVRAG